MFNQRQLEIVLELFENNGKYMTASYFARKQQVSLRTIQNDVRQIREELSKSPCLEFQSAAPKGSRVVIRDQEEFSVLKENLYQQFGNTSLNCQNDRINQILVLLLKQHRAMSTYDIENTIYVSHNTLLNDLKRVSDVLQKYHLELMRSSNKIMADGSEINKRLCLSEENLMIASAPSILAGQNDHAPMERIKNVLVETFVSFQHTISEVELNNTILQLYVAIRRMQDWFFIDPADLKVTEDLYPERRMAEAVFARLGSEFFIRVPDSEIDYLALYIKSQGNFTSSSVISQEMDDLVLDILRDIRSSFGIDLTNDLNLRLSLALHCTSLTVRIKYDMQLKNHLTDYIRQTFPQGYDLATYFASCLQKRFHRKVQDEEIAFLAIHLYRSLMEQQHNMGTRRVLVISSLRRSENLLLRQTLQNWFADQIAELAFIPPAEVDESCLDRYDTFITTEKGRYYDMGLALYISQFPTRQDYLNIKLAMDGFESINDILQIFHQDLFVHFRNADRDEILKTLCNRSSSLYQLDGFYEAVMEREQLGSTFFGNGIAAPHPIAAVSSDTFIAIGVSCQPVVWDSSRNTVHLVMMISVGKNNSKAFQLWNYLSKMFADRHFTEKLTADPGYDNFLRLLKDTIADNFNS